MKIESNPRRRRKHRRSRRRHRNPGIAASLGSVGAGFKPDVLKQAGVTLGGALLNGFAMGALNRFLPAMLTSGIPGYLTNIAVAGGTYALAKKFAPKWANGILIGGVVGVGMNAYNQYAHPAVAAAVVSTTQGLSDYLTTTQAADARALGGMDDYLTTQQASDARALGYMNDASVAEALAADGLSGSIY